MLYGLVSQHFVMVVTGRGRRLSRLQRAGDRHFVRDLHGAAGMVSLNKTTTIRMADELAERRRELTTP